MLSRPGGAAVTDPSVSGILINGRALPSSPRTSSIVFDNASRGGGLALVSKASRCGFPSYVMARGAGAWQPHSEQYVSGLERGRRRLGQSQVIHTNNVRSLPRSRRRCGAPLRAILSRCRRNRFSTSSRRRDLNRLATNIPSVRRIATIGFNHAMILPRCESRLGCNFRKGQVRRSGNAVEGLDGSATWHRSRTCSRGEPSSG